MVMRRFAIAAVVAALYAAWGQPSSSLSFEVASVKPAAPCCDPGQRRENKVGIGRIDFPNATLWYCISFAYGRRSYQMSGPDWLRSVRYAIEAKAPAGTPNTQLPEMMRSLLAERFKLQLHHETREASALALTVGKDGPKVKQATAESGDGQSGARVGISAGAEGVMRLEVSIASMGTFANTLTALLGRPVVDRTGLTARYDFILEFSGSELGGPRATGGYNEPPPIPPAPAGGEPSLSIFSAIQRLGLKLDAQKLPIDVIVVDSAERVPVEN